MKNNFPRCLRLILLLFLVSIAFSCNLINDNNASTDALLVKAENNLKKNPDSTIAIVNKLLTWSTEKKISPKKYIKIYQLKQEAYSNLGIMDSVLTAGKKIRFFASEVSDSLAIAKSLLPIRGDIDFSTQYEIAPYYIGAIKTFKKNNMPFESAKLGASYGTILCHKGDFVNAQTFLLSSYRLFNELDSLRPLINVCMNIGSTYAYTKNTEKSLEYYKKSYKAALKVKDSNSISSVLMNIGTFYADDLKDQNKALEYYKRASHYIPQKSGAYLKMKIDYNAAVAFFNKGDLIYSEKKYQNMLTDCSKIKAYEGIAMASKGLGDLYVKNNQTAKALLYLSRAIHLADSLQMSYEALQMRPSLLKLYKNTSNYKAALQVSEQIKIINDSILSAEKQNSVNELEIKYQTEKKISEISHLKALSKSHKLMLYGLSFFVIVLFFVLRNQNKLYREKQYSYALLMQKYKEERIENSIEKQDLNSIAIEPNSENIALYNRLVEYYNDEKPYLNSNFKANDVAKVLNVPSRNITAILKANGFNGFNNFNNKYRVADVKRQFEDPNCKALKMEVISKNAGFGNRQTFYTAFEEYTGLNPGFYRSEILK